MSEAIDEQVLKVALMQADLSLKRKQGFWETPRNLAIILGTGLAIVTAVGSVAGWRFGTTLGQQSAQTVRVVIVHEEPATK